MSPLNSALPAWSALGAHAKQVAKQHLRELTAADASRWQDFHLESAGWLLDYSRQRVTRETLTLLFDLARAAGLPERIAAMFVGH